MIIKGDKTALMALNYTKRSFLSDIKAYRATVICLVLSILLPAVAMGIDVYKIDPEATEYYFEGNYIEVLDDIGGEISFQDILAGKYDDQFHSREEKFSTYKVPATRDPDTYYWVRISINHSPNPEKVWLLEFTNQSLDEVDYYIPKGDGSYEEGQFGDHFKFEKRYLQHKNFELVIPTNLKGEHYYYFRVKCQLSLEIVILLRSLEEFVSYSLNEYLMFGFFYGMIVIVSLYNLLMFLALKERQFLYYILYVVFFGVYFMADNGTGFQYLWPNSPGLNEKSNAFFLYIVVLWAMLFTREFLDTKNQFPAFDRIILGYIAFRTGYFLLALFINDLFTYKIIEVIPIGLGLYAGIRGWVTGFRPARFFVLSYGFLLIGFIIKAITQLGGFPSDFIVNFYSMNIALCFDMLFITFAFADKISVIRLDKERAHKKIIQSLEKNQKLKDKVNRELEAQVTLRTIELDENNRLLREANEKLKSQADEINRMNMMLDLDNRNLKKDIKETLVARIMKPNVDFEEFKKVFPDDNSCFKYLSEKKQARGFSCTKCGNLKYSNGAKKYARRCSKCGYNESVTANTIFHGIRFPIEKAFYIFYLTITKRDDVTIDQMSELVSLRRNTCWAFKKKVVAALEEMKMTDVRELAESWDVIFTTAKS